MTAYGRNVFCMFHSVSHSISSSLSTLTAEAGNVGSLIIAVVHYLLFSINGLDPKVSSVAGFFLLGARMLHQKNEAKFRGDLLFCARACLTTCTSRITKTAVELAFGIAAWTLALVFAEALVNVFCSWCFDATPPFCLPENLIVQVSSNIIVSLGGYGRWSERWCLCILCLEFLCIYLLLGDLILEVPGEGVVLNVNSAVLCTAKYMVGGLLLAWWATNYAGLI